MKKNLVKMLWLSAISVGLVGCGLSDKTSPESCKFEVSQSLDKGDYDAVIQKLSSDPTCGGAYTQEEGKIQLSAAYIGKAGFSIPDVISDIIDSASKNTDTYQAFVQSVAKKVNSQSVNALTKARDLYQQLVQGYNCSSTDLPDIIKDACFYKNITNSATATSSLTLLIGGGSTEDIVQKVNRWVNPSNCDDLNDNGVGDVADVTASAIEYALSSSCSINGVNCSAFNSSLTFTKNSNSYPYTLLEIKVNDLNNDDNTCDKSYDKPYTIPYTEYRLIDTAKKTVVLTSGYCKTDFTSCQSLDVNIGCYPCPVIVEGDALDMTDTVVDLINNTDANEIGQIVGGTDKNVVQDIQNLKKDVCGADESCTLDEIKNYLIQ